MVSRSQLRAWALPSGSAWVCIGTHVSRACLFFSQMTRISAGPAGTWTISTSPLKTQGSWANEGPSWPQVDLVPNSTDLGQLPALYQVPPGRAKPQSTTPTFRPHLSTRPLAHLHGLNLWLLVALCTPPPSEVPTEDQEMWYPFCGCF